MAIDWKRDSFRLWLAFSLLWFVAFAGMATYQWNENLSRETDKQNFLRPECRAENPKPPGWCRSADEPAGGSFSPWPFLFLALGVPASVFGIGYGVGLVVNGARVKQRPASPRTAASRDVPQKKLKRRS